MKTKWWTWLLVVLISVFGPSESANAGTSPDSTGTSKKGTRTSTRKASDPYKRLATPEKRDLPRLSFSDEAGVNAEVRRQLLGALEGLWAANGFPSDSTGGIELLALDYFDVFDVGYFSDGTRADSALAKIGNRFRDPLFKDGEGAEWLRQYVVMCPLGTGDKTRWLDQINEGPALEAFAQNASVSQAGLNGCRALAFADLVRRNLGPQRVHVFPQLGINFEEKGPQYCGVVVAYLYIPPRILAGAGLDSTQVDAIAQKVWDRNYHKINNRLTALEGRVKKLEAETNGWSLAPGFAMHYLSVDGRSYWAPLGGGIEAINTIGSTPVILYGSVATTPNKTAEDVIWEAGLRVVCLNPFSVYGGYTKAWRTSQEARQLGRDRFESRVQGAVFGLGLDVFNHDHKGIAKGVTVSARLGVNRLDSSRLRPIERKKISTETGWSGAINLGYNF